jgi:hypothetical protein
VLYILKIIDCYECRAGVLELVVRAASEKHARELAFNQAEHEQGREDWLDSSGSTCEALEANGPPEVIISYTDLP